MTEEQREAAREYIRTILDENQLSQKWLVARLNEVGMEVNSSQMSLALHVSYKSPKSDRILWMACKILARYNDRRDGIVKV